MSDTLIRRAGTFAAVLIFYLGSAHLALAGQQGAPQDGGAVQSATPVKAAPQRADAPRRPVAVDDRREPRPDSDEETLDQNADGLRQRLNRVLGEYPDSVGAVLKLDPSLLSSPSYLAPYPALASFLAQHPQVARNPRFYLQEVHVHEEGAGPAWEQSESTVMWSRTMEAMSMLVVMLTFGAALLWVIRTVLDHRRWNKISKVQADFQNKVFDRFSSSEDLMAYLQTPAGRRLLEAPPIVVDQPRSDVGMPLRGILWAVQAGIVLMALGIGFEFVSGRVPQAMSQPLYVLGVLGISLGIGFAVAAAVSFVISWRLGLLPSKLRTAASHAVSQAD